MQPDAISNDTLFFSSLQESSFDPKTQVNNSISYSDKYEQILALKGKQLK